MQMPSASAIKRFQQDDTETLQEEQSKLIKTIISVRKDLQSTYGEMKSQRGSMDTKAHPILKQYFELDFKYALSHAHLDTVKTSYSAKRKRSSYLQNQGNCDLNILLDANFWLAKNSKIAPLETVNNAI